MYIYLYIANIEGASKAHHSRIEPIEPHKTARRYAEKNAGKNARKNARKKMQEKKCTEKNARKKMQGKKCTTPVIGARKTAERHADAPMAAYVETDPKYTPRMCCMKL